MKKIITQITVFLYVGTSALLPLSAQPGGGSFDGGEAGGSDTYVPIDGGIVTVTGLAIGYGLKQRRKRRNQKNNP